MGTQLTTVPGFNDDRIVGSAQVTENVAFSPASRKFMITASAPGTVALTLFDGSTVTVTVVAGDNIYPFAVTLAVHGTATVTRYQALY